MSKGIPFDSSFFGCKKHCKSLNFSILFQFHITVILLNGFTL